MEQVKLEYNSTYISINLIDELDYIIGGYGKPNSIFIYSLNAFLESFILNSSFYISDQEVRHFQAVSKSIFPNGRPILDALAKTKSLMAIGGIGNQIGTVVSIWKSDDQNPIGYQERVKDYIDHGMDTNEARNKYLILPNINKDVESLTYLNIGRVEDGFVATESKNSPQKFYSKLCEVTKGTNIQATLPFYNYKFQIEEVQSRGISKDIISKLTNSFLNRQKKLEQYFGISNQNIPPLVSILLSQCKTISDIPQKMIALREDFTDLRKAILKYEIKINESNSIREQLEAIDEINEFWKVFNRKYSEDSRLLYQFWEVAKDSDYEKSIDNSIDANNMSKMIEDLNLGKIAGKGAQKAFVWFKEKKIINRFRGVTDLWKLFENGPNLKKQIPLFEKVFDFKINEAELIDLNKKINHIKKGTISPD